MDAKKIKEEQFEALLRLAVIECFDKEMNAIPPREDLEKMYTFSDRHIRRMKKLFARAKRMEIWKAVRRYSYRVAAAFILTLAMLFGALMFNDNVRAAVQETIIEWFDTFTKFTFGNGTGSDSDMEQEWSLGFLPDGFVESDAFTWGAGKTTVYTNEKDEILDFSYSPTDGAFIATDNENADYKTLFNNGIEYHIFNSLLEELPSSVIWEYDGFAFTISALLNQDELMEIAISVRKK